MILEAMCYADEAWIKEMEQSDSPVYEFDEAWPVTIEMTGFNFPIEARVMGKGSILGLIIQKRAEGFKIVNEEYHLNYSIKCLSSFSNEEAIKLNKVRLNAFQLQTIATAVREIANEIKNK